MSARTKAKRMEILYAWKAQSDKLPAEEIGKEELPEV